MRIALLCIVAVSVAMAQDGRLDYVEAEKGLKLEVSDKKAFESLFAVSRENPEVIIALAREAAGHHWPTWFVARLLVTSEAAPQSTEAIWDYQIRLGILRSFRYAKGLELGPLYESLAAKSLSPTILHEIFIDYHRLDIDACGLMGKRLTVGDHPLALPGAALADVRWRILETMVALLGADNPHAQEGLRYAVLSGEPIGAKRALELIPEDAGGELAELALRTLLPELTEPLEGAPWAAVLSALRRVRLQADSDLNSRLCQGLVEGSRPMVLAVATAIDRGRVQALPELVPALEARLATETDGHIKLALSKIIAIQSGEAQGVLRRRLEAMRALGDH